MKKMINEKRGITLIALVVTIVVLLILAAVSIGMLTGENGIIKKASESNDKTEQAKVEELVTVAVNGLITEHQGDRSKITPDNIAEEVNKMENRTDVTAENSTFPTNILFPKEDRKVGVNIDLSVTKLVESGVYDVPVEESQIAPDDLFDYEIISNAEGASIIFSKLPTKTARITRIKPQYCNDNGYNPETSSNDFGDTNYEINYKGIIISDTLVIPYQVEIDGEMYIITEINLYAAGSDFDGTGYNFPKVETVIYPNTIEKIYGKTAVDDLRCSTNSTLKNVIFSNRLKEIGEYSFWGCINLDNIIIPSNVMSVGDYAFFKCDGLTSITIPNSVTSIGNSVFSECSGLTSITIPNSVTSIGKYAFSGCTDLTSITIPESVMTIEDYAFYGCGSLASITISNRETSIGNSAFLWCTNLTNIIIPENITNIGNFAFSRTAWYDNQPDGELYIGKVYYAYKGTMPEGTEIKIKEGTTSIKSDAFKNCTGLTSITIPDSITSIGYGAFNGCNSLTAVNYTGTPEQWNAITIGSNNTKLTNATINYNYTGE